jgi:Leucine rich repeat
MPCPLPLQVLILRNNTLTGNIPDNFGALSQLQVLDLGQNGLGGNLPISLAGPTKLKVCVPLLPDQHCIQVPEA